MALELMAPAGSFESVVAAVRAGADAIYFGAGDFNARRGAKNLSADELPEALRYCRLRDVKTYVTVNTLLTDRELPGAAELIRTLNAAGASAVIVQDLGVLRLVKALAPDLPVHASTQMTVHNLAGALACKRLGFSRVVLSRELPLDQIRFITQRCGVETEVFCHGALCMCYSGQCYLSAVIGGRSGNRGLCAQPCRLAYGFDGGKPQEYLSLKDLSLATHLQELEEAGVACVKIEGRMKRPEYTALVTSIYKKAIQTGAAPSPEELQQLQQVFSRSGFTDGYFTGRTGPQMFGTRSEADARAARPLYAQARKIYEGDREAPCIPVDLSFTALRGQPMTLAARDKDGFSYETEAPAAEEARTRATTQAEVAQNLSKTGGTVFFARRVDVALDEGLRIPAASVNAMRRQCLDGITSQRRLAPKRREGEWQPGPRRLEPTAPPGRIYQVQRVEQLSAALLVTRPEYIYLPLDQCAAHLDRCAALEQAGIRVGAVLPRILFDSQWPEALEQLEACKKAGITAAVCTNLGQAHLLEQVGMELRGDFGLTVMNSQCLKELKALGLQSATASFEMTFPQIRDLSKALELEAIVYGRLPLMIFENCAIRRGAGHCACRQGPHFLSDKTGRQFPLMAEPHCRNTLYNSEPLSLSDKGKDYAHIGLRWARLLFTIEDAEECAAVARRYDQGTALPGKITRGLYYRGVQ